MALRRSLRLLSLSLLAGAAACASGDAPEERGNLPKADDPVGATSTRLVFHAPPRGAILPAGGEVEVRGRVLEPDAGALTINSRTIDVSPDGSFTTTIDPEVGLNVLRAQLGGTRAQRSFLYGEIASPDDFVPGALALRVNRSGLDDVDGAIDDLAALAEVPLAERDLLGEIPSSYVISAPVVGDVDVFLLGRSAGDPQIDLWPRRGGMTARVTLPNLAVSHQLSFSCLVTTCRPTGTAYAAALVVTVDVDLSLQGEELVASPRSADVDLVNFENVQDGTLAQVAQDVITFFTGDLETRLEDELRPAIAQALPNDIGVALSQLSIPSTLDLSPALPVWLEADQRLDGVYPDTEGGLFTAAARVRGDFDAGDPGSGAPGWLRIGQGAGSFRTDPPFGASVAVDLINQTLFAAWGESGLEIQVPAGAVQVPGASGPIEVRFLAPPIVQTGEAGLRVGAGDVRVAAQLNGQPIELAISIEGTGQLVVDTSSARAHIELTEPPVLYAELLEGPSGIAGQLFTGFVEQAAPSILERSLGEVTIPIPSMPLDPLGGILAGRTLRLAPGAEVAADRPPGRVTLYGRFAVE